MTVVAPFAPGARGVADPSLALHEGLGFVVGRRVGEYAGVTFDGGAGLLRHAPRPEDGTWSRTGGDTGHDIEGEMP